MSSTAHIVTRCVVWLIACTICRSCASLRATRLVASLYGESTGETVEEVDGSRLRPILTDYQRITDYYAQQASKRPRITTVLNEVGSELQVIKTQLDFDMASTYFDLCRAEERQLKAVKREVQETPIWDNFLKDVKGCGPLMGAICIAYLDVYKARHCSSFWKYAGLDTVETEDGRRIGRNRSCTEMREYTARDGSVQLKKSLTYNPFLKTKLCGVLGGAFLKAKDSQYGKVYYDYKNRLQNRADDSLTPGHIHAMATRYAVKMFLRDLWVAWRQLEGLPVSEPYEVAFLGRRPHGDLNLQPMEIKDSVSQMETED